MRTLLAAFAVAATATAAQASIIPTLTGVTPDGGGVYTYSYQGYLAGDQGLVSGDKLEIFDFRGYVPGSVTNGGYANVMATATTGNPDGVQLPPGFTIAPGSTTLIWTYTGPNYDTSGGPFGPTLFNALTAESTFGSVSAFGAFSAIAEKNTGQATGTPTYNNGFEAVPGAMVPEPAVWTLMLIGVAGVGATLRARKTLAA